MKRKSAFTLAEVLVTLIVIGVIAALTIPALMQNMAKQRYVSALKRSYSNLSQAVSLIKVDNAGSIVDGLGSNNNSFLNAFANKMSFVRICYSNGAGNCWHAGNDLSQDGTDSGSNSANNRASAVLSDGSSIVFRYFDAQLDGGDPSTVYRGWINVDVNGVAPPNTIGRDIFMFYLFVTNTRGLLPAGTVNPASAVCSPTDHTSAGFECTEKVLREGAMNY